MSVKSPELLLKLSKNPFYKLTNDEKKILDDFLSQKSEKDTTSSPKKKSRKRAKTTPATAEGTLDNAPMVTKNPVPKVTGEIEEEALYNAADDLEGTDQDER